MTAINGISLPKLSNSDPYAESVYGKTGILVGMMGMALVVVTAIANWATIGDVGESTTVPETTLWAGGLGIAGLATIKVAVAIVLVGIILRLWVRVHSMKEAVPFLKAREAAGSVTPSTMAVSESADVPPSLKIHRMASRMWQPMVAMGAMVVALGAILRFVAADKGAGTESFREVAAWGIGVEFLGEALLLSGISFLLATILASLRQGGSEVQAAAGAPIRVLKMPATAKAFIMLMMIGLMTGIGQFIASIVLAGRADNPASYAELAAFVGPLREFALGVLLAGVVLALVTIGNVLTFQFTRVRELARR